MPNGRAEPPDDPQLATISHRLYDVPPTVGAEYRRRVALVGACLLGVFLVLWLRLVDLQAVRGGEFRERGDSVIHKGRTLATHRGSICDRYGEELALDEPTFDIALSYRCMVQTSGWLRRQARIRRISVEEVLQRIDDTWTGLAHLTHTSREDLRAATADIIDRVQTVKAHVSARAGRPVTIREETITHPVLRDVDLALVEQVLERRDDWIGVTVQVRSRRRYPHGSTAAHMLGYMLRVRDQQLAVYREAYNGDPRRAYELGETIGAAGVEAASNADLRGRRGWLRALVNARGDVQHTLERVEPEPGGDVRLTIDVRVQRAAEAALAEACEAHGTNGAVVLLNVHTGEVLAMASYPTFRPDDVRQHYGDLADDPRKPLLNRVIASHYPPGSVFKVVDSVAALEAGKITPATTFVCEKRYRVGNRYFHCEGHHGEIEFTTALAKSCNIYFYQVALATGQSDLVAWAYRFGFGRATGIELPGEIDGIVPRVNRHKGSTCNLAIGQGRLAVTPLQVATMMARVANGGRRIRPTIFLGTRQGEVRQLPVSAAHLAAVRNALREVVTRGTARRVGFDAVMPVAGKTGTAQVGIADREAHAWFAGYAPADAPQIAFACVIENAGHGGDVAAPLCRDLLRAYANALPPRTAAR